MDINGEQVMQDLEQAIRERAYLLWIEGGRQDGNADSHWLEAQREFLAASLSTFARVTAAGQAKSVKAKKATGSRKKKAA
jgi:Protein of unknown function (DUF2934)